MMQRLGSGWLDPDNGRFSAVLFDWRYGSYDAEASPGESSPEDSSEDSSSHQS